MMLEMSSYKYYEPVKLLVTGINHLSAAHILFECNNLNFFESAGYLAHMGIVLMLQSWVLYIKGEYEGIDSIKTLISQLKDMEPKIKLSNRDIESIEFLSRFVKLQYPRSDSPINASSEDIERIYDFVNDLWLQMPQGLAHSYQNIPNDKKGERILVTRPNHIEKKD